VPKWYSKSGRQKMRREILSKLQQYNRKNSTFWEEMRFESSSTTQKQNEASGWKWPEYAGLKMRECQNESLRTC